LVTVARFSGARSASKQTPVDRQVPLTSVENDPELTKTRPLTRRIFCGAAERRAEQNFCPRTQLGQRQSMIPGYKTVSMHDIVYQPKSKTLNPTMANDMVCHCAEGELRIKQGPGMEFVAKKGDVWSCNKGLPEDGENVGATVAIMRVIDLLPT
jgi:hypothetical protein